MYATPPKSNTTALPAAVMSSSGTLDPLEPGCTVLPVPVELDEVKWLRTRCLKLDHQLPRPLQLQLVDALQPDPPSLSAATVDTGAESMRPRHRTQVATSFFMTTFYNFPSDHASETSKQPSESLK